MACEIKYNTLLDLARQAKIITGNTACFDGKIEAGLPFSGYPSGVDTSTIVSLGVVGSSESAVLSGNNLTTLFDVSNPLSPNYNAIFDVYSGITWSNPLFSANTSGLTLPITPLSATTQIVGPIWTATQTGMTGDYVIDTQYTGYTITYSPFNVVGDLSGGTGTTYSAVTGFTSAIQENFSAGTLDYKGPLDYISSIEDATVDGRLTTKKLTVTDGASASTIGYVLTQLDETGKAGWVFNSASASTDTSGAFTSTTANNRIIPTNTSANSVSSDKSSILGGDSNTINTNSARSIIVGGRGNTVEGEYSFIGNGLSNSISGRGFWNTVINGDNNDLSLDPSSNYNTVVGNSHSITGTSLVANSILGGQSSGIYTLAGIDPINSTIVGGNGNSIYGPDNASIIGGDNNLINGEANNTSIIGGQNNNILLTSTSSFIGGGENNTLSNTTNSAIIGGQNITGTTDDTVYVPNLNIGTVGGGASINNLGIDASGNVVTGTTGGGTFTGNTSGDCITDIHVSNIHSCSPLNINPLDEGNVYFGANSGVTIDLESGNNNLLLKSQHIFQSPDQILSTYSGYTNIAKGHFIVNDWSGITSTIISNSGTSGTSGVFVGNFTKLGDFGSLRWFSKSFVRSTGSTTGVNFYQNKVRLCGGSGINGMVINPQSGNPLGTLWFEVNGSSVAQLYSDSGYFGLGLNPDGTELPTAHLQVGGTGTTGTFKFLDGNEQSGYVLTSDANGVGSWQASAGGGGATIDPYQDEGNVTSITWDVSGTSTNYEATLTGVTTLTMSNVRNGDYGTLIVTQDGVGSRTLSFAGGTHKVVNGGGGAPTLTTTAGATDILSFTYNGTNFYWTVGNDYT